MLFKKISNFKPQAILIVGFFILTGFFYTFSGSDNGKLVLNNLNSAQGAELENTSFNKILEMFKIEDSGNQVKLTTYEKKNNTLIESNFLFPENYTDGYKFVQGNVEIKIIPVDKAGMSYERKITDEVAYNGLNKKLSGQILSYEGEGNQEQHLFSLSRQDNILRQWSIYQEPAEELNVVWEFEGAVLKQTENNTIEVYKVPVDKDSQDVMAGLEPNMAQRIANTLKAELGDNYYYNEANFLFEIPAVYFITARGETKQAQVSVKEGNKLTIFLETSEADYPILLDPSISLASAVDYIQINGDSVDDYFGDSVAVVGDVNGDGIDDVIVGATADDDNGSRSGSAFIFYGGIILISGSATAQADVKLTGDSVDDFFGGSVSSAGDVNGDGLDDVIVGASGDDDGGGASGTAFIFYGGTTLISGSATAQADIKITGDSAADFFGRSVSSAGDINGDGKDDIIIGAYGDDDGGSMSGSAFIFYGGQVVSGSATVEAVTNGHGIKLTGDSADDQFGHSVSSAGDVNGDGKDDVIVGAQYDDDGGDGSGTAFILYGSATLASGSATIQADVKLTGDSAGDSFGWSVSGAGDVNGDGKDDVIVGAYADDDGGADSGSAFIFYGGQVVSGSATTEVDSHGVKLTGDSAGDFFGYSVSGAGDVNGDGKDDVIVGAFGDDDNGSRSGSAFIFYGGVISGPATAEANVKLIGDSVDDFFGISVSGAGDVNGDGKDDVIVSAYRDDDNGANSGSARIFTFESHNFQNSVKLSGDDANDQFGYSVSSAGDVNGDGKDDVIVGAHHDDDGGSSSGSAFIFYGGVDSGSATAQADVKLTGDAADDLFGFSVSSAGDMNGDGLDDIIVGAYVADDNGDASGSAFIFYSPITSGSATAQAAVKLTGDSIEDYFGWSVSSAGDVNGDGLDDVIVGAYGDDDGGLASGSAFIFYGGATLISGSATVQADVKLTGDSASDYFGTSVSSAGDINSDGKDDVIVGVPMDDDNGDASGSAFIFYGGQVVSGSATAEAVTNGHGVKLIGDSAGDEFGRSVSSAGDMNGDGKDDVIVGANTDDDGGSMSGSAFIFYSPVTSGSATAQADVKLTGDSASDYFGTSVSSAGDMNGDGKDDVIVGATGDDDNGLGSGSAFIFYGGVTSGNATAKADIKLTGDSAGDEFGRSVSSAGDVNGDGLDDVIVGAPSADSGSAFIFSLGPSTEMIQIETKGASVSSAGDMNSDGLDDVIVGTYYGGESSVPTSVFIFYGGVTSGSADTQADIKLTGDVANDRFGGSVSGAGDVNGDGLDDVIIGAYGSNSAFIFYGGQVVSGSATAEAVTNSHGVKITGDSIDDFFGGSVSGAGDVNGDGKDDVIVGAGGDDDGGAESGSAFIFYGGATLASGSATTQAGIKLTGDSAGDGFGRSVSSAGDVNGDGKDDVIVGARYDDDGGAESGSAFIFYGGQVVSGGATAETVTNSHGVKITGDLTDDEFGFSVSSAGDVNGDGKDDVIIGAYGSNSVFIFYGGQVVSGGATAETVTNSHGVKLTSDVLAGGDNFGYSVSSAGDVNGDGYDDVIVGAHTDGDGGIISGSAFIFYGGATLASGSATAQADVKLIGNKIGDWFGLSVSGAGDMNGDGKDDVIVGGVYAPVKIFTNLATANNPDSPIFKITGDEDSRFGWSVSSAGDVNGDGLDDIIVGAQGDDGNGLDSGSAFIFYSGVASGLATAQADVKLIGDDAQGYFGLSVSSAGDVNGDGLDDVIVGAKGDSDGGVNSGTAYIFYGPVTSGLATDQADVKLIGDVAGDYLGCSVSGAGDLNGDGLDDVIVGAKGGGEYFGFVFIFYSPIISGSATAQADVKLTGDANSDYLGYSVSGVGDVNGDGKDDVAVGAPSNGDGGSVFVFYSPVTSGLATAQADVKLTGDDIWDTFGYSVSGAGDVNGDGLDDIIVGAYDDDDNGDGSGSAFIFYGGATLTSGPATAQADVKLTGDSAGDKFGWSVSSAGDVNGDGLDDVIVGATGDDDNGAVSGSAFIFYGGTTLTSGSATTQADVKLIGDAAIDRFGVSVSSTGDVNGDGLDDVIVGAHWLDAGSFFGSARIVYGHKIVPEMPNTLAPVSGTYGGAVFVPVECSGGTYNSKFFHWWPLPITYQNKYGKTIVYDIQAFYNDSSGTQEWHDIVQDNTDGSYSWDVSALPNQTGVNLRCRNDISGTDGGWSRWYDVRADLEIDNPIPPNAPTITGPTMGAVDTDYEFSFVATDTLPWTEHIIEDNINSQSISTILHDSFNGKYIAAGWENNGGDDDAIIWESTDLVSWTRRNVDTTVNKQAILDFIYDSFNGKYIAAGHKSNGSSLDAVVWESTDLISWTQRNVTASSTITQRIYSIIYDSTNGKYVAGGYEFNLGAVVWESTDLISWTQRDVDDIDSVAQQINSIIYDSTNGKYIAAGYESNGSDYDAIVWESTDLISWTQREADADSNTQQINSILYDSINGKYIAAGYEYNGSSYNAIVWESTDLISWTQRDVDTDSFFQSIQSIIYDSTNGKYVAGGDKNNGANRNAAVWESTDLISWTQHYVDAGSPYQVIFSIIYDSTNGKYVAAGYDDNDSAWKLEATVWESELYDSLRYGIDWNNDGDLEDAEDEWLPTDVPIDTYVLSGTTQSSTTRWTTIGDKTFQVLAEDDGGLQSGWTQHTITISDNTPPSAPTITGTTTGDINTDYDFGFMATDTVSSLLDKADIGDPTSEASHVISGWSEANLPGGYGGCQTGLVCDYRQLLGELGANQCTETERDATVILHAGLNVPTRLTIRHLDGISLLDSFDVYIDETFIGSFMDDTPTASEAWEELSFDISSYGFSGDLTVRLHAKDSIWASCPTYGQVSIDWLELYKEEQDQIRYGIDWGDDWDVMDGVVDEWLPSFGYVLSGTTQSSTTRWTTTGAKIFQALAEDDDGLQSGWTQHTITIDTGNTLPTAIILAPNSTPLVSPIWLTGQFSDTDVGDTFEGFQWRDGDCSTSVPIYESLGPQANNPTLPYEQALSDGDHDIYFRVLDNQGGWSACEMYSVTINPSFQCSDNIDNDGDGWFDDGLIGPGASSTQADPACYDITDPLNPIYHSEYNDESADPQCSDNTDNDSDGLSDINDPGCHTDGDPTNAGSYDKFDNDENNCGTGVCEIGETYVVCPQDCPFVWIEF